MWSLNRIRRSPEGKWTLVRTINLITNTASKDGEFSEELCGDLTADCVRNTRSLGSEKIERIVQYTKQRYNIGGSSSRTHGGTACISTSGTLKFDFSQLMDTSA